MEFRNDIQGLRALAVFFVFIFHLSSSWLPGGFVGVDVFFVISGYLVSSIIFHELNEGRFSILYFYEKRIKRIVPAMFFFLLLIAAVVPFVFVTTDIYAFRKSLFWTILFNSNNHFASLDNYFGALSSENPLLHTWTLAVEMQFYLILPLILMAVKNRRILNYILLALTIGLVLYGNYHIRNGDENLMYFSLLARMPEFLMGVLAASWRIRDLPFVKKYSSILSTIGLFVLLSFALTFNETIPFPGATAMIPCIGTGLILVSSGSAINRFLSGKELVYFGKLSYSIYLWHWPVMALIRYRNDAYELSTLEMMSVVVVTILVSLVSFYCVENSMRKLKGISFYLPFGALTTVTASMVFLTILLNQANHQDSQEFFFPSFGLESHGASFQQVGLYGDSTAQDPILLIGDSHALGTKKIVDVFGKKHGLSFRAVTNDAYPTVPGIGKEHFHDTKVYNQYLTLANAVEKEIPKAKLIIVQFSSEGEEWTEAIESFLSNLDSTQRVIVLKGFPILDKNPVRLNRGIVKNSQIKQAYTASSQTIDKKLLQVLADADNVSVLDFSGSEVFIDIPFYRDTLIYYDHKHINAYGAQKLAEREDHEILERIQWGLKGNKNLTVN